MADVYSRLIRKSGKRLWYAECNYVADGRRVRVQRSTGVRDDGSAKAKATAEMLAADIERALALGTNRIARPTTLEQAIDALLLAKEVDGRSAGTFHYYGVKSTNLIKFFKPDKPMQTIDDQAVLQYAKHRLDLGRERPTVGKELLVLRQAFDAAGIPRPKFPALVKETGGRRMTRWLDITEQRKLLSVIPHEYRPIIMFYLRTGCRKSDPWKIESVDWDKREMFVAGTKTPGSRRTLVIDDELFDALQPLRYRGVALFKPWKERDAGAKLGQWSKRAGIGHVSFNTLRHSYATFAQRAKMPILFTASLMGTSVKMLEKVYAHVGTGEHMHEAAALMPTLHNRPQVTQQLHRQGANGGPSGHEEGDPAREITHETTETAYK